MSLFDPYRQIVDSLQPVGLTGRVSGVRGLTVSVEDFPAPIGAGCRIVSGSRSVEGRVIGFAGSQTLIMPLGAVTGIRKGDRVVQSSAELMVAVSRAMLGRVLNARGLPIDGRGDVPADARVPIWCAPMDPMRRRRITDPLPTGIRAVDGILTAGRGQRMGILSASGAGKSVMLAMIARFTAAEVTVIGLIGERGREVRDFIERDLGAEGLRRSVVVVSTGDEPPLARVQAAAVATAIAEYFRDRGLDVVLLMDSLTRLAGAQRQIGLAAGEPPATKGFPPSVFSLLPELLERCGKTETGSITGFYSALVEGDDPSDPITDAVRSVTDGHVYLSRDLANRGHYPAVDVLRSISRVRPDVTDSQHRSAVAEARRVIAAYSEVEDLLNVGAYESGSNPTYDLAIRAMPWIREFLAQPLDTPSAFSETVARLKDLARRIREWTAPRRGAVTRPVSPAV
ncbi:MAG TPA: FliI/YscN family ATPase [Phycisphaerae bacterium]|nr:FliI/YscN family ATPase [Phycisphaerae bacterium]